MNARAALKDHWIRGITHDNIREARPRLQLGLADVGSTLLVKHSAKVVLLRCGLRAGQLRLNAGPRSLGCGAVLPLAPLPALAHGRELSTRP